MIHDDSVWLVGKRSILRFTVPAIHCSFGTNHPVEGPRPIKFTLRSLHRPLLRVRTSMVPPRCRVPATSHGRPLFFSDAGERTRINLSFRRNTGESAERRTSEASAAAATASSAAVARGRRPTEGKDRRRISWVDFAYGRSSRRWISPRCSALPRDSLSARRSLCRWHSRCS